MNSYLLVTLKVNEIEEQFRFEGSGPYSIGFSKSDDISLIPYFPNACGEKNRVLEFTLNFDNVIISNQHETRNLNVNSDNSYKIEALGITLIFEKIVRNNGLDSFESKINFSESLLRDLENKKVEQQKILLTLQTQVESNSDKLHTEERRVGQLQNEKNELELNIKKIDFEVRSKTNKLETLEDNFKKLSDKESTIKNEISKNKNILEESKNSIENYNSKILDCNNTLNSLQKEINDKKHLIEILIEEQMLLNTKIKNGEELRQSGLL